MIPANIAAMIGFPMMTIIRFAISVSVIAASGSSSGFTLGLIHSFTIFPGMISDIRSWMERISSPGSLVRITNTGRPFSILYGPRSQASLLPFVHKRGFVHLLNDFPDFRGLIRPVTIVRHS